MGKVQRQTGQYRDHLLVSVPYSSQFAISNPQIVNIRIISEKGQWERNRKVKSIWYSISKESIHLSYFLIYTWYLLIISFILETSSKQTGQQRLWISWLNPQHLDWKWASSHLSLIHKTKVQKTYQLVLVQVGWEKQMLMCHWSRISECYLQQWIKSKHLTI